MNKMRDLLMCWEANSSASPRDKRVTVQLTTRDYARISALAEIYANRTEEQLLGDIVSTALDELEAALPYIKGNKVIAEDEFGDPVYEDIGMTPKFEDLTKKYTSILK